MAVHYSDHERKQRAQQQSRSYHNQRRHGEASKEKNRDIRASQNFVKIQESVWKLVKEPRASQGGHADAEFDYPKRQDRPPEPVHQTRRNGRPYGQSN